MKLCTCNNCGAVFEDVDPGKESIDYNVLSGEFNEIIKLPVIDLKDGDKGYGCPHCEDDGYLQDNINPEAGGVAAALYKTLGLKNKKIKSMKPQERNRDVIYNFIEYFSSDESERESMKKVADDYIQEDHVDGYGDKFWLAAERCPDLFVEWAQINHGDHGGPDTPCEVKDILDSKPETINGAWFQQLCNAVARTDDGWEESWEQFLNDHGIFI